MALIQSPSTRTSIEQKLKARNCALMLKNGSPKLRDMLREVGNFFVEILKNINSCSISSEAATG